MTEKRKSRRERMNVKRSKSKKGSPENADPLSIIKEEDELNSKSGKPSKLHISDASLNVSAVTSNEVSVNRGVLLK